MVKRRSKALWESVLRQVADAISFRGTDEKCQLRTSERLSFESQFDVSTLAAGTTGPTRDSRGMFRGDKVRDPGCGDDENRAGGDDRTGFVLGDKGCALLGGLQQGSSNEQQRQWNGCERGEAILCDFYAHASKSNDRRGKFLCRP